MSTTTHPTPTLDQAIAADYGVHPSACTCGPRDGCFQCVPPSPSRCHRPSPASTPDAAVPADGRVKIGQLDIGCEFRTSPHGRTYTALAKSEDGRSIAAESHPIPGKANLYLHVPIEQLVIPVEPVTPTLPMSAASTPAFTADQAEKNKLAAETLLRMLELCNKQLPPDQLMPPREPAAPKVITPTVGRKVWFYPSSIPNDMSVFPGGQPLDATIVHVENDHRVNLVVFDHAGKQFAIKDVHLQQPGDECGPANSYAAWMPYQVTQAAKA